MFLKLIKRSQKAEDSHVVSKMLLSTMMSQMKYTEILKQNCPVRVITPPKKLYISAIFKYRDLNILYCKCSIKDNSYTHRSGFDISTYIIHTSYT